MAERTCPNCGLPASKWKGNDGKGYRKDGRTYCCQLCADAMGCMCI
jgi:hypothetical protein